MTIIKLAPPKGHAIYFLKLEHIINTQASKLVEEKKMLFPSFNDEWTKNVNLVIIQRKWPSR